MKTLKYTNRSYCIHKEYWADKNSFYRGLHKSKCMKLEFFQEDTGIHNLWNFVVDMTNRTGVILYTMKTDRRTTGPLQYPSALHKAEGKEVLRVKKCLISVSARKFQLLHRQWSLTLASSGKHKITKINLFWSKNAEIWK